MIRKRTQAREYALQVLYHLEINPGKPLEILKEFWNTEEIKVVSEDVRSFTETIITGTSEHLREIDQVIDRHADNWSLARMAVIDRNILRYATYELLFASDIPPKVTINEAVNLAKKFSQEESGKFVNGILDKITHTEKPIVPKADETENT